MRREKKSLPGMFFLLAFGTTRILTRQTISTLSRLTSHPVVGRPGGEVPFTSIDLNHPGTPTLQISINLLCNVAFSVRLSCFDICRNLKCPLQHAGVRRRYVLPTLKSSHKRLRQNRRARLRNRSARSELRTVLKKAATTSDRGELETLMPQAVSVIDKSVRKGVLHRNTAARYKSDLARRANSL